MITTPSRKRRASQALAKSYAKKTYYRRYKSVPLALRRFGDRQGPIEQNYIDIAQASYVADTTGSVTLLNGVAQGDDNTNRHGRQATFKSISIKGLLQPVDTSTATQGSYCRLLIVWDAAPNGVAPVITDLLVASTACSHNNLNNRARFKILADEQYAIGGIDQTATQAVATSPCVVAINRYVKLPNVVTTYSGTGATIASIQQGAIWMFTIGSIAASFGGQFNVAVRVRFTDD